MASREAIATREIAELHRAAQERLALIGALAAVQQWQNVDPHAPTANVVIPALREFTGTLRRVNVRLASRYYNLVRSIEIGRALPNPYGNPYGPHVTVDQLYNELGDVLREVIADPTGHTHAAPLTRRPTVEDNEPDEDRMDDLDDDLKALKDDLESLFDDLRDKYEPLFEQEVEVDENFDWPEVVTDNYRELEREVRREVKNLKSNTRLIEDEDYGPSQQIRLIRDQHNTRGFVLAGAVTQEVQSTARQTITKTMRKDKRVLGWMRATGPHPCAFCSMLASRGFVYGREPKFHTHDNCQCSPVPIFTKDWALSLRDKFFRDNWEKVTKKYKSGRLVDGHIRDNDKLRAWRRWLTEQYRAGKVPDQDVYGPARPTN